MDLIDDERMIFYLRHREDIDQWAALRKEARRVLDTFLKESAPDFEQLAPQLGDDVKAHTKLSGRGNPYVRLLRSRGPPMAAGAQRSSSNGLGRGFSGIRPPTASARTFPFGSIEMRRGASRWQRISGRNSRQRPRSSTSRSDRPPVGIRCGSTSALPDGDFWTDLSEFRQSIIDHLELFWTKFADDLDQGLGRH